MREIYADYNATTPLSQSSIEEMKKAFEIWGNPSSAHRVGQKATQLMEESRRIVAEAVGARPSEIVFTSGGSEANNLAILGSYYLHTDDFRLVSSRAEHSSVGNTSRFLESQGVNVKWAPTLPGGSVDFDALKKWITEDKPHLVSLMAANNETGVISPIEDIAKLCKEHGVVFHTDAVQAFGKTSSKLWEGADLVSVSAHKIGGPKGIGALVIRNNRKLVPTVIGGSQEIKRRGGTQNTIGICGFSGACKTMAGESEWETMRKRRDQLEATFRESFPDITIQGEDCPRVCNTSNVRFPGIPAEILLSALDMDGIYVSAGSACSSGSITPSHVLIELGLGEVAARECWRISWSWTATQEDFDTVAQTVINHVKRIKERRNRK